MQEPARLLLRIAHHDPVVDHEDIRLEIDELPRDLLEIVGIVAVPGITEHVVIQRMRPVGRDPAFPETVLRTVESPRLPPVSGLHHRLTAAAHDSQGLLLPVKVDVLPIADDDGIMGDGLAAIVEDGGTGAAFAVRSQELVPAGIRIVGRAGVDRQRSCLADREAEIVGMVSAPPAVNLPETTATERGEGGILIPAASHDHMPGRRKEPGGWKRFRIERLLPGIQPEQAPQRLAIFCPSGLLAAEPLHPSQAQAVVFARERQEKEIVRSGMKRGHRAIILDVARHADLFHHQGGECGQKVIPIEGALIPGECGAADVILASAVRPGDRRNPWLPVGVLAIVAVPHIGSAPARGPGIELVRPVQQGSLEVAPHALQQGGIVRAVAAFVDGRHHGQAGPPILVAPVGHGFGCRVGDFALLGGCQIVP